MSETVSVQNPVFVSREKELTQLQQILESVKSTKKPKVVFIQGDYGVGKTTLVKNFIQNAGYKDDNLLIGRGQFTMEKETGGYGAFGQALIELLDKTHHLRTAKKNLGDFLLKVAPAWIELIPVAGSAISATITTIEEIQKIKKPKQAFAQQGVFNQFSDAIDDLSEKQPLILFLDDFQWADEASYRLLFHLGCTLANRAVLILAAYRPVEALETGPFAQLFQEIRANLIDRSGAEEIKLENGIDENGINAADYIRMRYPSNLFPKDLATKIQTHTRGHALFISQIFFWWEESGSIKKESGPTGEVWWRFAREADLDAPLPIKVGEIIDARIRRLTDQMQQILKCASVEGELFTAQTILSILDLSELVLGKEMTSLEKKYRLVEYENMQEVGNIVIEIYQFLHRYFRERIYSQQVVGAEKHILHRRVAQSLEQIYASNIAPVAGQLARHYKEAGLKLKAAQYGLQAARYEMARSSWLEAKQYCEQGLKLLYLEDTSAEVQNLHLDLLEALAESYYWAGRYEDAERYYAEVLNLAENLGVRGERLITILARYAWSSSDFHFGLKLAREGIALVENQTIPKGDAYMELMVIYGGNLWAVDDVAENEEAVKVFHTILDVAPKLDQTPGVVKAIADAYRHIGSIYSFRDQYEESLDYYQHSIDKARQIGYTWNIGQCLVILVDAYVYLGKYEEAEQAVSQGAEIAKQVGDQSVEVDALLSWGLLRFWQKEYHSAIDFYQRGIQKAKAIGYNWNFAYYYADLAEAYLALGDLEKARQAIEQSITEAGNDMLERAYAASVQGAILDALHDWEHAEEEFQQSLAYYEAAQSPWSQARIKHLYGSMLFHKGDKGRAVDMLTQAKDLFDSIKLSHMSAEIETQLCQIEQTAKT